jgi:drug/metabolite transporter (DMT)-like permease
VVYGAIAAPGFRMPTAEAWPLLAALAAIALAVHACTTVAYRVAASMLIGALDYSRIIWAALIGYLFLAETPDLLDAVGAVLIVLSGFIVMRLGRVRAVAAAVG